MKSAGICVGAANLSWVQMDNNGEGLCVVNACRIPHEGDIVGACQRAWQALRDSGCEHIAITGRKIGNLLNLPWLSEPEAVEKAFKFVNKDKIRFNALISAGAELFIAYILDRQGNISGVRTNNKCASGTGEFFLQQIRRMNVPLEDALKVASSDRIYRISGRCSVFCKSDCTHALNKGANIGEVLAGLCEMMAKKISELLVGVSRDNIMLVGGVALNKRVVDFLKKHISRITVPHEAAYFEATGACLWALENGIKNPQGELFKRRGFFSTYNTLSPLDATLPLADFIKADIKASPEAGDLCILGLDVGSTTTKAIILRVRDDKILDSVYLRTNGNPVQASRQCYKILADNIKVPIEIIGLGVTGSGRQIAALHAKTFGVINEIIAHAKAAVYFDKDVDTIFEIGGQDAKYTYLINGLPSDYAMNEACSAGTGSFLEESCKESLGIEMQMIASYALKGKNPPNFNDQCAAFISSDIKTACYEGLNKDDIIAGLVYSICANYLNRVKGNRAIGNRIFMQGGVCFNQAVPLAMASLLGKQIIVPPEPGLMGAFGLALEIKERLKMGLLKEKRFDLLELANRDVRYYEPFKCKGAKEGCDRGCEISRIEVVGDIHPFGGACNKYYNLRYTLSFEAKKLNLVSLRQEKLFESPDAAKSILNQQTKTIGINKSFLAHNLFPLYYHFFTALGMQVVLSNSVLDYGVEKKGASFCFPAEISHGLFQDLLEKKTDYIFLPQILELKSKNAQRVRKEQQSTCVILQAESYYLKSAFKDIEASEELSETTSETSDYTDYFPAPARSRHRRERLHRFLRREFNLHNLLFNLCNHKEEIFQSSYTDKDKILSPVIDFSGGFTFAQAAFIDMAKKMGFKKELATKAYIFACQKQEDFIRQMKDLGRQYLTELESNPDKIAVVILGRAYNAFSFEANMAIPDKFASRGVMAIPFDCLPYEEEPDDEHMYWATGQMLLKASRFIKKHPQLFATFITNFSCGPDSFIVGQVRDIMDKKPVLILEIDSHTQDAGINTRIEAFLDIVESSRRIKQVERLKDSFIPAECISKKGIWVISSQRERLKINDRRVKVLIPPMGKLGPEIFSAVFRSSGINSISISPSDSLSLKYGRGNTSCKECLPLILSTGGLIRYLEEHPQGLGDVLVYFMPATGGNCRFGQYQVFLKNLIRRKQIQDLTVWPLDTQNSYVGLGQKFNALCLKAIVISDAMYDIKNALGVLAKDKEEAIQIFEQEWQKIIHCLETNAGLLEKQLEKSALMLGNIALKYPLAQAKFIALMGEIYVRRDDFCCQTLIERLAQKGFVLKTAPVLEWLYYVDYLVKHGLIESNFDISERIEFMMKNYLQRKYEVRLKGILAKSGLYKNELIEIEEILRYGRHFIDEHLTGESIVVVGAALREIMHSVCGIINIGPFACLPTRIIEAILSKNMDLKTKISLEGEAGLNLANYIQDLPFLFIETDGNPFPPIIEARLEAFSLQADRLHNKLKMNEVSPRKLT